MRTYKVIIGGTALGLFALSLLASRTFAHASQCTWDTTSWNNAGVNGVCYFSAGGTANVSSLSGIIDSQGHKGLIADLQSASVGSNYQPSAQAVGLDLYGNEISGCKTGVDYSTAQGATVGDGDGCENATHHRLYAYLDYILR